MPSRTAHSLIATAKLIAALAASMGLWCPASAGPFPTVGGVDGYKVIYLTGEPSDLRARLIVSHQIPATAVFVAAEDILARAEQQANDKRQLEAADAASLEACKARAVASGASTPGTNAVPTPSADQVIERMRAAGIGEQQLAVLRQAFDQRAQMPAMPSSPNTAALTAAVPAGGMGASMTGALNQQLAAANNPALSECFARFKPTEQAADRFTGLFFVRGAKLVLGMAGYTPAPDAVADDDFAIVSRKGTMGGKIRPLQEAGALVDARTRASADDAKRQRLLGQIKSSED